MLFQLVFSPMTISFPITHYHVNALKTVPDPRSQQDVLPCMFSIGFLHSLFHCPFVHLHLQDPIDLLIDRKSRLTSDRYRLIEGFILRRIIEISRITFPRRTGFRPIEGSDNTGFTVQYHRRRGTSDNSEETRSPGGGVATRPFRVHRFSVGRYRTYRPRGEASFVVIIVGIRRYSHSQHCLRASTWTIRAVRVARSHAGRQRCVCVCNNIFTTCTTHTPES